MPKSGGATTRFYYNPLGLLTQSIDPDGFSTHYEYDQLSRLIKRTHPDAGEDIYHYDPAGNLTLHINNLNDSIRYHYHYNLLTDILFSKNHAHNVHYTYGDTAAAAINAVGKIILQEDASGWQKFFYGKMGEVTQNIRTFALPNESTPYTFVMNFEYDSWNRIQTITYPDGEKVNYRLYGYDGARYTFSAKEKDAETGYSYFGSRYYHSDLSIWLSIDPMSDKYPSLSPYNYCADNPVRLIDPNGEEIDWVEKVDGTIYWDDNAISSKTTKEGEKYLGKNVLVATHGRDANLNEAVNGAIFDLYLESDHTGATASIVGNTVPCDVNAFGTLPEGLYETIYNGLYREEPSLRILQKKGESYYNPKLSAGDLPTVKGNPNNSKNRGKDKSQHIMNGILFHLGNYGQARLRTSKGRPITEGCQTGKHGKGSKAEYHKFASHFIGKDGIIYYLRAAKK